MKFFYHSKLMPVLLLFTVLVNLFITSVGPVLAYSEANSQSNSQTGLIALGTPPSGGSGSSGSGSPQYSCRNFFDLGCNIKVLLRNSLGRDNGWNWLSGIIAGLFAILNHALVGEDFYQDPNLQYNPELIQGPNGQQYVQKARDPGLIGFVGISITGLYDFRPVNSVDYLASINPFKPAYAAGSDVINPVLELWKIFRNLAYVLIVVFLIGFGFLVMFRYKIDPRTVVTISDALPRTVVALILITFSFTISGLVIDGSKLLEKLITNSLNPLQQTLAGAMTQAGGPGLDSSRVMKPRIDVTLPGGASIKGVPVFPVTNWGTGDILNFWNTFTGFSVDLGGTIFNALTKEIGEAILNFMLLSMMVQLLISLLRYFAAFFILTIFGPLIFLWAILPGQEETGRKWFMQLLTAALVFPTVFLLLNIAYFINLWLSGAVNRGTGAVTGNLSRFYTPEFTGSMPQLIQSITQGTIGPFIAVGILILTSKVPEIIEEALKAAPSGRVAGAGTDLRSAAKRVPFVGGFV